MNAINWFEIPTLDLARAERFYAAVLGRVLLREEAHGVAMSTFTYERPGVGGALVHDPRRKPAADGALAYLAVGDLDAALSRVPGAGGSIVRPKADIGEHGFLALVRDTEGNVIGLHAQR